MSLQSAGTVLCEPTQLYNILTQARLAWLYEEPLRASHTFLIPSQCDKYPAVVDDTYLLLFGKNMDEPHNTVSLYHSDTRSSEDYNEGHILLAKLAKKGTDDGTLYRVPFGANLSTCRHCVVYDSSTVSVIEDSE